MSAWPLIVVMVVIGLCLGLAAWLMGKSHEEAADIGGHEQ